MKETNRLSEFEYYSHEGYLKHRYGPTYSAWLTGAAVKECLVVGCDMVCAYWDEDDLEEDGHLYHYISDES